MDKLINELMTLKDNMKKIDINNVFEYYSPNPPADNKKIEMFKKHNIFDDSEILSFYQKCNGWKCFYQMVDLFGTEDYFTDKITYADVILKEVLKYQDEFTDQQVVPIAISQDDMDIFVLVKEGKCKGNIIWFAGGEIERFSSFKDFFAKMTEYCKSDFSDLKSKKL